MKIIGDARVPTVNVQDKKSYERLSPEMLAEAIGRYTADAMDALHHSERLHTSTGMALSNMWQAQGPALVAVPDVSSSEAIRSTFISPPRMECQMAAHLSVLKGLHDAIGSEDFDRLFPAGTLRISRIAILAWTRLGQTGAHFGPQRLLKFTEVQNPEELRIGDWTYFKNHDDYMQWNPGGGFSGEHVITLGSNLYHGYGCDKGTEQQYVQWLTEAYNHGAPPPLQKTTSELPGLRAYSKTPFYVLRVDVEQLMRLLDPPKRQAARPEL